MLDCDNRVVSELFSNALLHYVYLPVVLGSLVSENKPIISISTAHFILIQTFSHVKHQPIVNAIVGALLLERVPKCMVKAIEKYPEAPMGYSYKWKIRMPVHYQTKICKLSSSLKFDLVQMLWSTSMVIALKALPVSIGRGSSVWHQ